MSVPPAWGRTQACMRVSVCYTAHTRMRVCARCVRGAIEAKTMNDPQAIAQAVVAALLSLATQPAEAVAQTAVSVANKAQKITWATRKKVKANRVSRGGPIPNGPTCEELYAAGIITIDGDYIADATAPTATKVTATKAAPTDKQLMRMTKKELVALLQG